MSKYGSYGITISTAEPVEGTGQHAITNWLKKQDFAYSVIEGGEGKEQKRHLHAQVWYETPREKGTIDKALKRIIKSHFPESEIYIALKTKIAYNDDYLEKYMAKDITEIVIDKIPENRERFYPTQEEQEKTKNRAKCADHKMNHLEELFREWVGDEEEPTSDIMKKAQVSRFLTDMMYKSRKIKVPPDMKIQKNLCSVFTNYLWQKTNSYMLLSKEEVLLYDQDIENNKNIIT